MLKVSALIVGGYFALMLPKANHCKRFLLIYKKIKNEIIEAFIEVRKSKEIFPVSISMIMVGLCFMGNNLVTLPYITTERYGLGASGFATVSTCFWLGTFFSNSILALNKNLKTGEKLL